MLRKYVVIQYIHCMYLKTVTIAKTRQSLAFDSEACSEPVMLTRCKHDPLKSEYFSYLFQ